MQKLILCFLLLIKISGNAQELRLVLPVGHAEGVTSVDFSADGKKVVTTSYDNSAKIWDANTGSLLSELIGHTHTVEEGEFSPDGNSVVTVSVDGTAKIWDAGTGRFLKDLIGHTDRVSCVQFSPDGKKIVTGSDDYSAIVWDAVTGFRLFTLKGHDNKLRSVRFSADGKKVITTSSFFEKDFVRKTWDAETGVLLNDRKISRLLSSAKISPDGKIVLTAEDGAVCKVWTLETGALLWELKGHGGKINDAGFSPDGKFIVTVSADKTARIWDAGTGELLNVLDGHLAAISSLAFSKDVRKLVTGSDDRTARIWDLESGQLTAHLSGHISSLSNIGFDRTGTSLISSYYWGNTRIWDLATMNLISNLKGPHPGVTCSALSMVGNKMITAAVWDSTANIWDLTTGQLVAVLKGHRQGINDVGFSPDGKWAFTASKDDNTCIWETSSGKLIFILKGHKIGVNTGYFSPDGTKIVTASDDCNTKVWELSTGKTVQNFRYKNLQAKSAIFSPDGKTILTVFKNGQASIWNALNGKMISFSPSETQNWIDHAEFCPDGINILTYGTYLGHALRIWDPAFKKIIAEFKGPSGPVFSANFSKDGKRLVTRSNDSLASIWEVETGKFIRSLNAHRHIKSAECSPDGKRVVTLSEDNTGKLWDAENGNLICDFYVIDSSDFLVRIPSGYYQATPAAARFLHYVTEDLKVISFEQLDVKYNRPDKVLEALGSTDTVLVRSYRKAWEKRIEKLGLDTTAFRQGYSVPDADFVNRDQIRYDQKQGTLNLKISGADDKYKLTRFNIWINEVPLYGRRGIVFGSDNRKKLDTTISVALSQGINKIETSVFNANGSESYRMPLVVNYTPVNRVKEKLHFIGIGMDRFSRQQYDLQYSGKDIRDLVSKLKEKYADNITIDTLFNENVSKNSVLALKTKLTGSGINDKVLLAYSGHGLLSKDFDYYLSTYKISFEKPSEFGLPYDELENLLDSIPARKKLMLIDACHSGEVDKEELVKIKKTKESNGLTKGGEPVAYSDKDPHLGLKNSFDLMRSIFVNVGRNTGATVISAASGTQFALERDDLKNGVFTYSILEAMNKFTTMKISELRRIVGLRVEELTNGLQKPTSRNENIAVDWSLW